MDIKNQIFVVIIIFFFICIKKIVQNIEQKYIFQPTKISKESDIEMSKKLLSSINYQCPINQYTIETSDSEKLDVLYHHKPNNKLILYAHGNAGNIYMRLGIVKKLSKYGSVLLFDYRGYGLSTGQPSEKGLHIDIYTVWNYAINVLGYSPDNIIVYGNSLGCSVVLWLGKYLVKKNQKLPKGIIIESGFYNLRSLASEIIHPSIKYIMNSKFDNIRYIKRIKDHIALLVIHSHEDEMINISHAQRIIKDSGIQKDKLIIISGTHNEPNISSQELKIIEKFIIN